MVTCMNQGMTGEGANQPHIDWKVASKSAGAIKILWLHQPRQNLQVQKWAKLNSHRQICPSDGPIGVFENAVFCP